MQLTNKKTLLMIFMLIFTVISIIFVYSSSFPTAIRNYHNPYYFFIRQFIWYIIAYVVFIVSCMIDYKVYKRHAVWVYVLGIILLCLVFVIGKEVNGAKRWIGVGPINFAPAEVAKLLFVMSFSSILARFRKENREDMQILVPSMILFGVYMILIFLEKDFGTIAILAPTVMGMLFFSRISKRYFIMMAGLGTLVAVPAIFGSAHRISRVMEFISGLKKYGIGGGYQVKQSIIGIGNGGLFGLGLGNGAQKYFYLPELHTDFIFSVIGEEGGFFLCLFLILCFVGFFYIGFKVSLETKNWFAKYFIAGFFLMTMIQTIMNLLVATGLMPATGRPLPFISYGGSSIVILFWGLGIVFNIIRKENIS